MKNQVALLLLFTSFALPFTTEFLAQGGRITGRVYDQINNEPLSFATVQILELSKGAVADVDGNYRIENIPQGTYTLRASFTGYEPMTIAEVLVTTARPVVLDFPLRERSALNEVVIEASPFKSREESPLSLNTLSATELERYPGANRDVSRVIQALPGVAQIPSFRNDIIIRGGASGENKFYLDDIEVPNINHFATQGSSGGPVGLLNINFIREVEFYSGAFPANRANGLSSVLSFRQKRGNSDGLITNFAVGSSDFALTFDGPLGQKSNFIFSYRISYLQFLFQALKLPFLPTYQDSQFKIDYDIDKKNRLTFIGLGALDLFQFNERVNEGVTDSQTIRRNNYILGNVPAQEQWNYTVGAKLTHFSKNSYQTFVASRNMLNNSAIKYRNNVELPENLILNFNSFEAENKFRFEHDYQKNGWKVNAGLGYEYARFYNRTLNQVVVFGNPIAVDFLSQIYLSKFSMFGQVSKRFLNERLASSLGLRTDFSNFAESLMNPFDQLSPMLSLSYELTDKIAISGNVGRYHQLPAYTILGFRNNNNELVNRDNNVKYIRVDQFVLGADYKTDWKARFSVEGFYKSYSRYPFSLRDSISLANLGSDFGVIGNEPVASISEGRAMGVEFLYQQRLYKGFYGIVAYTYVISEFKDKNGSYVPSSWDNRNIVSLSLGKSFKKNWDVGVRWRYSGGAPYTPIDIATSSLIANWNVTGRGLPDWNQLNAMRLGVFHQLDVRVDKKFFFPKWNMNFYIDIQNLYNYQVETAPVLLLVTDDNNTPLIDPNNPSAYQTELLSNVTGTVLPTLGIIIEFSSRKKTSASVSEQ
jgi:hypothetical protein